MYCTACTHIAHSLVGFDIASNLKSVADYLHPMQYAAALIEVATCFSIYPSRCQNGMPINSTSEIDRFDGIRDCN